MLVLVAGVIAVAIAIVLLAGRAMGRPVAQLKFDETPADVSPADISDGTPRLDMRYDCLAPGVGYNIPRRVGGPMSAEDIAIMEKFGAQMKSERRP